MLYQIVIMNIHQMKKYLNVILDRYSDDDKELLNLELSS